MSFNSKEKVVAYLSKILSKFKLNEFREIIPEYFQMSHSSLEDDAMDMKVKLTSRNLSQVLLLHISKANWDVIDILKIAFDLELEYVIRHSNQFEWFANKFVGTPSQQEIADIQGLIQGTIRREGKDALVLAKKSMDLFWISVIMKNLKRIGIYEKPRYLVLSPDARYFFRKSIRAISTAEYVMAALGFETGTKIKLSGKSLPSLMKLLTRRKTIDPYDRPVYQGGDPIQTDQGIDFTQKKAFEDFYNKCVDTDIELQRYTITSTKCPWLGDEEYILKNMEFKTSVTLSGDVGNIIKQLPVASIVKPPIPNYLRNYSIKGRNQVSLKSPLERASTDPNRSLVDLQVNEQALSLRSRNRIPLQRFGVLNSRVGNWPV